MRRAWCIFGLIFAAGCTGAGGSSDAGGDAGLDAGMSAGDSGDAAPAPAPDAAPGDAGSSGIAPVSCTVNGNPGQCVTLASCATRPGYTSTPGHCPGPTDIQCCAITPNIQSDPPIPTGYRPMTNAEVTPAMTAWAVAILRDPTSYPMFSTATMSFGSELVLARVEWHPPDFQNHVVHRGVTLYLPK